MSLKKLFAVTHFSHCFGRKIGLPKKTALKARICED
jgi:hypothetical protein